MSVLARAAMMPCRAMSSTLAAAMRAGAGVRRRSPANGVAIGSPNASTSRQAMVVAALHRHLLTEDGAQAHLEAVERAGHAQSRVGPDGGGEARVSPRCLAMRSGRALRSNSARTRLSSAGSDRRQGVRELDHAARAPSPRASP